MGITFIFVDKDYVRWLSLYYPDALPDDLRYYSTPPTPNGNFGHDSPTPINSSSDPDGP